MLFVSASLSDTEWGWPDGLRGPALHMKEVVVWLLFIFSIPATYNIILGRQPDNFISHELSWHWANQSLSFPNNAECMVRNAWLGSAKTSMFMSVIWLDQGWKLWVQIPRSPKTGDGRFIHSAIPSGGASNKIHISVRNNGIPVSLFACCFTS